MTVLEYVLGSLLILVSIVLIIFVMAQKSRENGLSGAIAGGGSDTFFGKHKGRSNEAKMATATKWLGSIFFVLAFAATLLMLFF